MTWTGIPAVARLRYSLPLAANRPTVAEVDLGALVHNFETLQAVVSPARVVAVVKADGYGHGAAIVASTLEAAGADAFAVALVEEGLELRSASVRRPILVLGGVGPAAAREAFRAGLTPVVYDPAQIAPLAAASGGAPLQVHLKIDTGMCRLGVDRRHLGELLHELDRNPAVRVAGVLTHLGCADAPDPGPTQAQLAAFDEAIAILQAAGIDPGLRHAAASAGAIRFPESRLDLVRLGISLYGVLPSPHPVGWGGLPTPRRPGLEPVLRVRTTVLQVREVPEGTAVGYGGTFVTRRPSRIATLAMGYADGLSRLLSNRGEVLVHGRRAPIAGNVCMDMTMVDVTEIPDVAAGDEVVVLGAQGDEMVTADEVAERSGTISYEVLTSLSRRVPRVYSGPGSRA
jgi:alanine racemase